MSAILTSSPIPPAIELARVPVECQPVCHRRFLTDDDVRSCAASIQLRRNLAAIDTYTVIDNRSRPLLTPVRFLPTIELAFGVREIASGAGMGLLACSLFRRSRVRRRIDASVSWDCESFPSPNLTPPKFPAHWVPFARGLVDKHICLLVLSRVYITQFLSHPSPPSSSFSPSYKGERISARLSSARRV